MLLDWLSEKGHGAGFAAAARAIEQAVRSSLNDPATRTPDLGGRAGTRAMAGAISKAVLRAGQLGQSGRV
jgi:3-isopropylmalate dehydrogenase